MRIPSGKTDQYVYFVAQLGGARVTGLSSFTVYRSRNGAAAAAFTTPTVNETDSTNMPGVYELLMDEDTTIASGSDSEEMVLHITKTGMDPVTRTIELYRRTVTSGDTLATASGGLNAAMGANVITATALATDTITAAKIAADAIGASELAADAATEIGTAVWATAARTLTANTNLNDLSAAGVRAAVGLASANLDTQLDALPTNAELATALGTADDAVLAQVALVKAKTDNLPAAPAAVGDIPTANQNADALLDQAAGVETNRTLRQAFRLMLAALVGKASGMATTTATFRDTNDSKDRIVATVDADGNRSAVTLDAS